MHRVGLSLLILLMFSSSLAGQAPRKTTVQDQLLPGDVDYWRLQLLLEPTKEDSGNRLLNPNLFSCGPHSEVTRLLGWLKQSEWAEWIEKLSGAKPVTVGGIETTIQTRYSYAMFQAAITNASAYPFVLEQVKSWFPADQIAEHSFKYQGNTWKNLIATLPGTTRPDEIVILSAHLDSMSNNPYVSAPGAEDNASGSATVLLAAHWMSQHKYERTVRLIWFTGEEQGLLGSDAYVAEHSNDNIVGVINLDMFGYDSDKDRCFELHVGTLPASDPIGQCYVNTIAANKIDLGIDYLTSEASQTGSDHASFWHRGFGAVEVLENYSPNGSTNGCKGRIDRNPNYHKTTDTIDKMYLDAGFDIARAALATAANMAVPVSAIPDPATLISPAGTISGGAPTYTWNAAGGSTWYFLWVNGPSGSPVIQTWYTAAQAGCDVGTGACSVIPAAELAAGQHTWWIQTWNAVGFGPWSDGLVFNVYFAAPPAAVTLVGPAGTLNTSISNYSWNAAGTATWYYLWVNGPAGAPVIQAWFTAVQAGCGAGAGICSVPSPATLGAGQYAWWVQAWNPAGYAPWSARMDFQVNTPK